MSGAIVAGPATAGEGFPGSLANIPLAPLTNPKQFQVGTGILSRNVAVVAPAFGALQGVGPTDTVTQGDFLYFKSDNPLLLRITTDDGMGGTAVELCPVHGLLIREFSTLRPLELLEAQGNARVEYFVSGPR